MIRMTEDVFWNWFHGSRKIASYQMIDFTNFSYELIHIVEIKEIFSHAILTKLSWKHLLKKLLKSCFDEIFFQWEWISRFSTLCDNECIEVQNIVFDVILTDFFDKCISSLIMYFHGILWNSKICDFTEFFALFLNCLKDWCGFFFWRKICSLWLHEKN